jgi:hypothetical protein
MTWRGEAQHRFESAGFSGRYNVRTPDDFVVTRDVCAAIRRKKQTEGLGPSKKLALGRVFRVRTEDGMPDFRWILGGRRHTPCIPTTNNDEASEKMACHRSGADLEDTA